MKKSTILVTALIGSVFFTGCLPKEPVKVSEPIVKQNKVSFVKTTSTKEVKKLDVKEVKKKVTSIAKKESNLKGPEFFYGYGAGNTQEQAIFNARTEITEEIYKILDLPIGTDFSVAVSDNKIDIPYHSIVESTQKNGTYYVKIMIKDETIVEYVFKKVLFYKELAKEMYQDYTYADDLFIQYRHFQRIKEIADKYLLLTTNFEKINFVKEAYNFKIKEEEKFMNNYLDSFEILKGEINFMVERNKYTSIIEKSLTSMGYKIAETPDLGTILVSTKSTPLVVENKNIKFQETASFIVMVELRNHKSQLLDILNFKLTIPNIPNKDQLNYMLHLKIGEVIKDMNLFDFYEKQKKVNYAL